MHRPTVGIIALLLLAAAGAVHFFSPDRQALLAACLRVGMVMAVLWLALPDAKKPVNWAVMGPLLGLVVAFFLLPKPLKIALVLLSPFLLALLWPQIRGFRQGSRETPPARQQEKEKQRR